MSLLMSLITLSLFSPIHISMFFLTLLEKRRLEDLLAIGFFFVRVKGEVWIHDLLLQLCVVERNLKVYPDPPVVWRLRQVWSLVLISFGFRGLTSITDSSIMRGISI